MEVENDYNSLALYDCVRLDFTRDLRVNGKGRREEARKGKAARLPWRKTMEEIRERLYHLWAGVQ